MNDRQVENLIDVLEDMTFAIKLGSIMIVITILIAAC